mmetsp:Transcript_6927/g.21142  ORF Transcript_6927/g.21142 Transcript_6927/m.21142 type:complete len:220 (+) Transcript_6927:1582-2241(+)
MLSSGSFPEDDQQKYASKSNVLKMARRFQRSACERISINLAATEAGVRTTPSCPLSFAWCIFLASAVQSSLASDPLTLASRTLRSGKPPVDIEGDAYLLMKESERMQSSICCNSVADQQGPCTEAEDSSPEHPSCFLLLVAGRSAVDEMDPLALPEPPLPSVTELMNLKRSNLSNSIRLFKAKENISTSLAATEAKGRRLYSLTTPCSSRTCCASAVHR